MIAAAISRPVVGYFPSDRVIDFQLPESTDREWLPSGHQPRLERGIAGFNVAQDIIYKVRAPVVADAANRSPHL